MRELELIRDDRGARGVVGNLRPYGEVTFQGFSEKLSTLELPWRKNLPMISCIPAGSYICQFEKHRKFGETYKVLNVPRRSGIYFHRGNYTSDILGCILVGARMGVRRNQEDRLVLEDSTIGHGRFMGWLLDPETKTYEKRFVLHIRGVG